MEDVILMSPRSRNEKKTCILHTNVKRYTMTAIVECANNIGNHSEFGYNE